MSKIIKIFLLVTPMLIGCTINNADTQITTSSQSESVIDKETEIANFCKDHELSLKHADSNESQADDLFKNIADAFNPNITNHEFKYGQKFFLSFILKTDTLVDDIYYDAKEVETIIKQGEYSLPQDIKCYFIDINNFDNFRYFFERNITFFETCSTAMSERPYYINQATQSTRYETLLEKLTYLDEFPTPVTFLFDFAFSEAPYFGLADIMFDIPGKNGDNSPLGVLKTVVDCWNHDGIFKYIA